MEYVYIHESLQRNNLRDLELSILSPNNKPYHTLCFQPKGIIAASNSCIKVEPVDQMLDKCTAFVNLALSNNVDLAIAPEYCVPWLLIANIINDNLFPEYGKTWIFGCQSITVDELKDFIERTKNSVIWIYDDSVFKGGNNFLDPACYILKAKDNGGQEKNLIIVQFKTKPMGGADDLEMNNLTPGNKIYVINNDNTSSVNLITFICSDLLNFVPKDFDLNLNLPYLLVHIQLVEDSRHQELSLYRKYFINPKETENKVEIISLNWAKGTESAKFKIDFSGSAFYLKTSEINKEDLTITENHNKGLYYTSWANTYSNIYYLNTKEGVYFFKTTKVSQRDAGPAGGRRTGPNMTEFYAWNQANKSWINSSSDDGVNSLCNKLACNVPILSGGILNPVDKERLVTLSCGFGFDRSIDKGKWHHINGIDFFKVDDTGIIKRVTFVQDNKIEAERHRSLIYAQFVRLINAILKNSSNFPSCIMDLYGKSDLSYVYDTTSFECNYNLFPLAGGTVSSPATVAYIGVKHRVNAEQVFDNISTQLEDYQVKRLVVWYDDTDGKTQSKYLETKLAVNEIFTAGNDITREN